MTHSKDIARLVEALRMDAGSVKSVVLTQHLRDKIANRIHDAANTLEALAALRPAADPKAEELAARKEVVLQEYRWGNLTPLGVANHLRRAGYNSDYASLIANELASSAPPTPDAERAGEPLYIVYTNWRGETAERTVMPLRLWYGSTEWHHEPGWLLKAIDVEKGVERDFAWSGIDFQGNGTAASPDVSKAAAYYPAIIHFDEGGFDEFVTEDAAMITGDMRAADIEPIFRMAEPRDLIGYRIYDAAADTEGATKS